MADRRLVMLAYWYPPCQAYPTAAARVLGFARHLPDLGWRPVVVVPDLAAAGLCDCEACRRADTAGDVDGVEVRRVPVRAGPLFRAWSRVRPPGDRWSPSSAAGGGSTSPGRAALAAMVAPARALAETRAAWSSAATAALDDCLPAADALWTTSWPYLHAAVGRRAAARHGVPWVADLRDPVSRVGGEVGLAATAAGLRRRGFARDLRRADRVIEVSEPLAALDAPWLGSLPEVIRSGYHPGDWEGVGAVRDPDHLTLAMTGSFYRGLNEPGPFLAGLAEFVGSLPNRDEVRLEYHGRQGALLQQAAEEAGVADVVRDRGWVSASELRPRLRGADALVLQANTAALQGVPGGKFYDYLAAGPPILAYPGADRFVAEVLATTGAGVSPRARPELVGELRALHAAWRVGDSASRGRDEAEVRRFSQEVGAARLATVLDEVVRGGLSPSG